MDKYKVEVSGNSGKWRMNKYRTEVYSSGDKYWYFNGISHRENGPAIEYTSGYREWRINGILHREDGPAVTYPGGSMWWYLDGNPVTEEQHRERAG